MTQRVGLGFNVHRFAAPEDGGSVYKFYLPREDKRVGSEFGFRRGPFGGLRAREIFE